MEVLTTALFRYYAKLNNEITSDFKITSNIYLDPLLKKVALPKNLKETTVEGINIIVPIEMPHWPSSKNGTEPYLLSAFVLWSNYVDYDISLRFKSKSTGMRNVVSYRAKTYTHHNATVQHSGDVIPSHSDIPPFKEYISIPHSIYMDCEFIHVMLNVYSAPETENYNVVGLAFTTKHQSPTTKEIITSAVLDNKVTSSIAFVVNPKDNMIYPALTHTGLNFRSVSSSDTIKNAFVIPDAKVSVYDILYQRVVASGYLVVSEPDMITQDSESMVISGTRSILLKDMTDNPDLLLSWLQ